MPISNSFAGVSRALADDPKNIDSLCPVARSTALIGDRWSLLIIRELFMGGARFQDLQAQTGATAQMLTARLKRMEAEGIVQKTPYSSAPPRYEYRLTKKGTGLRPVLLALSGWGEKWCKFRGESAALNAVHTVCGTEVDLDGICPTCARVPAWSELAVEPTRAYLQEREDRAESFRAVTRGAQ